ncbi:MAG: AAA family ATPase, partial [Desulforhopalus sp.]|nr:AAA family ATPase [Desulforhopalus sp.]
MYRSFYRLTTTPFTKHPDPPFWWVGKKQRNSLAALNQGIFEEQGFLLLSGDAGTGKTTLCRVLTEGFDHGVLWTALADPRLERLDFYNAIAAGFAFGGSFTSKVEFLLQIGQFLQQAGTAGKRVLLLIDDSHQLSQELLEDLRLLVNLGNDQEKLLNILLVGRQELNHLLEQPKNRAIYQRLTVREEIIPLTGGETEEYLAHRLLAAGAEEKLFTDAAVRAIYTLSGGVPQQINALAEQALMVGAGRRLPVIGDEAVLYCARSLGLAVDLIDSVDTPGGAGFAGGLATSEKEPDTPQSGRKPGRRLFSGKGRWATALAVGGLLLGSYYLFDRVPSSP